MLDGRNMLEVCGVVRNVTLEGGGREGKRQEDDGGGCALSFASRAASPLWDSVPS